MRVLVCGSRSWSDYKRIKEELAALHPGIGPDDTADLPVVIDGDARGADKLAHQAAVELGYGTATYPADWKTHGKRAGILRNAQMLAEGKPDLVIAFWDGSSRGTLNMIEIAQEAGVPTRVIR
jgi:hypothetical protein